MQASMNNRHESMAFPHALTAVDLSAKTDLATSKARQVAGSCVRRNAALGGPTWREGHARSHAAKGFEGLPTPSHKHRSHKVVLEVEALGHDSETGIR